jgi:hypothetical protein
MGSIVYSARCPAKPLNMNDGRGTPWERRDWKDRCAAWKQLAWALGNSRRKPSISGVATFALEFGTNRPNQRRDPHNWAPTAKYLIDGFTLAGLWPDDNSKHVRTDEPAFVVDVAPDHFRVTITWEEPNG